MSGYYNFSMSQNAVAAYDNGEKPLSKWRKSDIISAINLAIKEHQLSLNCCINKLNKLPVKVLKEICLYKSSWHHTSSHYNKTDFYSLDVYAIEELTDERIDELIQASKDANKESQTEEKWKCAFLEWSGSRKHPKATEVIEIGIIKGNWFYRADGSKKKTTANGFRYIEKVE